MKRTPLSKQTINNFVKENKENAHIIDYRELAKNGALESCFYDELPKTEIKGFPFASDFVDENGNSLNYKEYAELSPEEKKKYRLKYYYMPLMHELYIGTTGSGKTTTCIEPQLRAISSQKNKPNIFVTDPKGEIFLHNAKHLKKNGYKVQVINFKNPRYTFNWNPLGEIYEKQMSVLEVGKGALVVKNNNPDPSLVLGADEKEFMNGYHIVYDGFAFPSNESYQAYLDSKRFNIHAEVTSLVNQLCSQMFENEDFIDKDPVWSNGAREFLNGIILALLDDAINPKKDFKKEMLNIKTINDVVALTYKYNANDPEDNEDSYKLHRFFKGKSKEAMDKIEPVAVTAESTKKGFLSTYNSRMGKWNNGHIFSIILDTTIDLDDEKQPIALFVITRDYDRSDNTVAALFLNWVYREFLKKAENQETKNGVSASRPLHFMLDEFANIPAIPDFETKIATSRSRNMWFHIFLQSYEQLHNSYSQEASAVIIDNCNQQTFLGSQSVETKEKFSRECGQKTVISLNSIIDKNTRGYTETVPVIALSDLNIIEEGWMYSKRIKQDTIKHTFVRNYQCANEGIFEDFYGNKIEELLRSNFVNPADKKYQYKDVIPDRYLEKQTSYTVNEGVYDGIAGKMNSRNRR